METRLAVLGFVLDVHPVQPVFTAGKADRRRQNLPWAKVMALTAAQHAAREGKIGASFLPKLMAGDPAVIMNEWRRLVGDPTWEPDDLSGSWPVQFGSYIETFALDWHERKTGRCIERRGESVVHPDRAYVGATLDGFRPADSTVIDCKAPGAYRNLDDVLAYYVPQMVVQRACVGASNAALLVVHGGAEPAEYPIDIPADYEAEVWTRIDQFWLCVETLTPPFAMTPVDAPVKPERTYDFTGRNEFAFEAAAWLENYQAGKTAAAAEKALKSMVPADAAKCHGHGVIITRNRAGHLSLRSAA